MTGSSGKRQAEMRKDQPNKRHNYDDRDRRDQYDRRGEHNRSNDSDRQRRDQNYWHDRTSAHGFNQSPRGGGPSPKGRSRSPPRGPHSPPRHPRSPARDPSLPSILPPTLAGLASRAIQRKTRATGDSSTRTHEGSGNGQEVTGASDQDSTALAEEFLQGNASLLHPVSGTEGHHQIEAHFKRCSKSSDR